MEAIRLYCASALSSSGREKLRPSYESKAAYDRVDQEKYILRKQFVGIFLGRGAQFLLALATVRVATTLLSPVEMGRVSLVVTTTGFFIFLLVNPVGMFINRRLHPWFAQNMARRYLSTYGLYLLVVAVVAALCLPILQATGQVNFGLSLPWQIALICGSLIMYPINNTAIPSLNLLGYGSWFIVLSVGTVAMSLIFATAFARLINPSAQYWLLGIMAGQACVGFLGSRVLFERLRPTREKEQPFKVNQRQVATLFGFVWPVSIAAVLGWVQSQGYRYLLGGELGLKALGLFVVGYGISMGVIAAFESVITAYFQPRLYRDASSSHEKTRSMAWERYAEALIPSLLLTTGLIVVVAPELARLFLGREFQSAAVYVVWGGLADATRAVVAAYSLIAHVKTQTRWLLLPNVIGAVLSIGLCILLIPRAGADGVGLALTLSGLVVIATMHIRFSRHSAGAAFGASIRQVAIFVLCLWASAALLRRVVGATAWWSSIAILIPICLIFLSLQYFVLRAHIPSATELNDD